MKELTIKPLSDRVIIERVKIKSSSGIILPDNLTEKSVQGQVVAVGLGKFYKGSIQSLTVKVGDIVLFNKFSGSEIIFNNKELIILREDDILGIIN